jgi:uncharacterized membrane protein
MQCTSCGSDIATGAAFCANCGGLATVGSPVQQEHTISAGLQSNVAGLLCYLVGFITGIFFLLVEPYKSNRFVRFHAFQSIFVSVVWIVAHFALGALFVMLPWTLWPVTSALSALVSLAFLLLVLLLMYKAYTNEKFKLPVIGDVAEKQA